MALDPTVLGPAAAFVFVVMGAVVRILWLAREEALKREREAITDDRDFWRSIALRGLGHAEKATDLTDKAIDHIGPRDGA